MKHLHPILAILLLFVTAGCGNSEQAADDLISVDVLKDYPHKELILQDFMDVEYIPLETNDEFVCRGRVMALGHKYIIVKNAGMDGNIYIFDRKGKSVRRINRKGNSGEEYGYMYDILLDEEKREIFVNDMDKKKVFVYDLSGNFLRHLNSKEDVKYRHLTNFDKDNFICWNYSFETNPQAVEMPPFYIVSKQDGHTIKEFGVPIQKRTTTTILSYDEKTKMTYGIFNTPNTIHHFQNCFLLSDPSSDTIYSYSSKRDLKPYMVRTPSIHTMNPEVFLYSEILTDKYHFLRLYEKKSEGWETDLVYDKQEKAIYRYTLYNGDYTNKKWLVMRGQNIDDEIAKWDCLDAPQLVEAYEKGQLKGKLKEIAATLDEESNPVIMLIKHKK